MNRVKSFETLRFLFCISIFLNHCTFFKHSEIGNFIFEYVFHNGRFGVTFFFVLSGFLLYKRNENLKINSFNEYIIYIWKHMKTIYPLYVITMVIYAIYNVANGADFKFILFQFLLSLTMLQTMTIKHWGILNSVGWYLATLFILYLISPIIIRITKKIKINHVKLYICVCICINLFADSIIIYMKHGHYISGSTGLLLGYTFPLYWVPVYFCSMLVAKLKLNTNTDMTQHEIVILLLAIMGYFGGIYLGDNCPLRSVMYQLICMVMIKIISLENGKISRLLSESKMNLGGGISSEIYLIHFPVINLIGRYIDKQSNLIYEIYEGCLLFIITLLVSICYKRLLKKHLT